MWTPIPVFLGIGGGPDGDQKIFVCEECAPGTNTRALIELHQTVVQRNGCCLHIVLDDGNVRDRDVEFCAEWAEDRGHDFCFRVAHALRRELIEWRVLNYVGELGLVDQVECSIEPIMRMRQNWTIRVPKGAFAPYYECALVVAAGRRNSAAQTLVFECPEEQRAYAKSEIDIGECHFHSPE